MSSSKYAFVVLIAMVLIFSPQPGVAEDTGKFGFGVRASFYGIQEDHFSGFTTFAFDVESEFDAAVLIELDLTYFFCRYFSLELSAGYVKTDMDYSSSGFKGMYGELEQVPILLTARVHWPVTERLRPYIGGGAGYYINDIDKVEGPADFFFGAPPAVEALIDEVFGFHAAAGIEFFISDHFAFNLDVKYIWQETNIGFDGAGFDSSDSSNLDALVAGVGVKYYF
ncbi:OmpW family protein [Thermodesulfobacteriota bacterium]